MASTAEGIGRLAAEAFLPGRTAGGKWKTKLQEVANKVLPWPIRSGDIMYSTNLDEDSDWYRSRVQFSPDVIRDAGDWASKSVIGIPRGSIKEAEYAAAKAMLKCLSGIEEQPEATAVQKSVAVRLPPMTVAAYSTRSSAAISCSDYPKSKLNELLSKIISRPTRKNDVEYTTSEHDNGALYRSIVRISSEAARQVKKEDLATRGVAGPPRPDIKEAEHAAASAMLIPYWGSSCCFASYAAQRHASHAGVER